MSTFNFLHVPLYPCSFNKYIFLFLFFFFCLFIFLSFFRAAPVAYGGSQARGPIGAVVASLHRSHSNTGIQAASATYNVAHSNPGSLTHWARSGIEPAFSWILVGFVNRWATRGTPITFSYFNFLICNFSLVFYKTLEFLPTTSLCW